MTAQACPNCWTMLRQGSLGPCDENGKPHYPTTCLAVVCAQRDELEKALRGLVENIQLHRSGECPGITPTDCLDAIYESQAIARAALERLRGHVK